jgi:hypothetical protein
MDVDLRYGVAPYRAGIGHVYQYLCGLIRIDVIFAETQIDELEG